MSQHHPIKPYRSSFSNFKWALRQKDLLSFAGATVAISLILRLNYENSMQSFQTDRNTSTYNNPRSVLAMINTAETGIDGLTQTFIDSWECGNGMDYPSYSRNDCPTDRMVLRAHNADIAAKVIQQHRQEYPGGQCLIVTGIRSPATWLPSLYAEKRQICQASSMTKDDMLRDYRRFLGDMTVIGQAADSCLPTLLTEFHGGSIREQMEKMEFVGGFSILGTASPDSAFAGCELLFLQKEQSDRWPDIIKQLVPDTKFYGGESHTSPCPDLSDHIKMLHDYELTRDEKINIYTHGGELLSDWFDSYGYMEERSPTKERSYNTIQTDGKTYNSPQSVIAMINTPKTGTEGLTQNFRKFWKCSKENESPFAYTYACPDEKKVIRAHQFAAGTKELQLHRQAHPGGQCLIVTSIRHPATWFPSLYAQRRKICENFDMTKDDMLNDYKAFLADEHSTVRSAESALPGLIKEFPFGSLKEQAKIMDQNGGYSILAPTSPESLFAGCELLFLRIEQSEQWPEIIQMMVPEIRYERTVSQSSRCPKMADHVKMLKDYELTMEEKIKISTYGGGLMADWFDTYDYI